MNPVLLALKEKIATFPTGPGVYLMKNAREKVVYVGKAKSLRNRVRSYFLKTADESLKTRYLMMNVASIDYILTTTEVEAFLLEASLIKKHRPRYNIRLKDDKAYPYIRCSMLHDFPRFYLARRVQQDGSVYFGPFPSSMTVRETIRFLNRTFKIRDCSDSFFRNRTRPCISYQIGQCTAPCANFISKEDYRSDVQMALEFFKGKNSRLLNDLKKRMKQAADEERFEYAAKLRNSIQAIERIWDRQVVVSTDVTRDQDIIAYVGDERGTLIETMHVRGGRVIGSLPHFMNKFDSSHDGEEVKEWLTSFLNQFYVDNMVPDEILLSVDLGADMIKLLQAVMEERHGKKPSIGVATGRDGQRMMDLAMNNARSHFQDAIAKVDRLIKGLEMIQERFGLPRLPHRIECYDISNLQGQQNVASQVVFEDGSPKKSDYRRYRIKTVEGANDFASFKEVLTRRFQHQEWEEPDLILVDGGKGQLNMAVAALKEIGRSDVPVASLAKARTEREFTKTEVTSTEERFFLPGRQNPLSFPPNSEAFQILVGLRDEAHRFAITYHRHLRSAQSLSSALDGIVGLGEKRKQALLKKFSSIEELRQAPLESLIEIPGMNRVVAERVLLHLRDLEDLP